MYTGFRKKNEKTANKINQLAHVDESKKKNAPSRT